MPGHVPIDPSSYEGLKISREGAVLTVALHNPGKKNALTPIMHDEIERIWDEVDRDDDVNVVILTGTGDAFCSGLDLNSLQGDAGAERQIRRPGTKNLRKILYNMLDCEKPIIGKIRGPAYGHGLNILLGSDMVIASENAKLCDSHAKIGVAPGDGGTAFLPILMGFNRAKEYLMFGDPIPGPLAAEIGLVNYCIPDDELDGFVHEKAHRLAKGAPLAISYAKMSVNLMLKQMIMGSFEVSAAYDMLTLKTEDSKEGVAALMEKRDPQFKGH